MDCTHHWLVPSPRGNPTETAICNRCGDKREVLISLPEDVLWQGKGEKGRNKVKLERRKKNEEARLDD